MATESGTIHHVAVDRDLTGIAIKNGYPLWVEVPSSNFPKYTRNPNTGERAEFATAFKKVTQTVFHSSEYPSHLVLPILN